MKTWDDLSIKEKADIMGVAISNGITTLPEIKAKYNEFAEGGELSDEYYTDVENTDANEYKSGGKIYIKPSHRGRFTELKKRTGHSATWFKQHGTPAQRKMATFALNAKHWKHGLGGNLFLDGGDEDKLIDWIIREEGFIPTPKNIGDGKITLGSGLTNPKWHELYRKRGNKWSEADNRKAVAEEIALRRLWAEQNIPNWQILPVDSQNAMLSYKYNYDFNENNSPKMYAALKAKDWEEAAKQMDATSSDPKFKKGLEERRLREQKLFLSGFTNSPMGPILPKRYADYQETAEPVSIQPILPFLTEQPIPAPIMVPDENQYVSVHTQTQEDIDRQEQQRAIERLNNIERFNRLMNIINVQNNPTPTFVPQNAPYTVNSNAFGGNLFSGEEDGSQQMENEFPFGDQWLKEVPVYGDVERARRANNWLLNRGLVPRWSSLGNSKGTFSFLPQDQPIQQGLEIVSPEFDLITAGNLLKPVTQKTTNFLLGRTPIPFAEKQAAAKRMTDLINSKEYILKQKAAGMNNEEIAAFQNMVERRLNGGNFPAYYKKNLKQFGQSRVIPFIEENIYIRKGLPREDFLNTLDHEVAHFSTANIQRGSSPLERKVWKFIIGDDPNIMEKPLSNNARIVPHRPKKETLALRKMRGLEADDAWVKSPEGQRKLKYYRNEQENRANAYALLQEANRRGISVDNLINHYTMQGSGEIFEFAPRPLQTLNYAYTPDNIKKFMKGFLSISSPIIITTNHNTPEYETAH